MVSLTTSIVSPGCGSSREELVVGGSAVTFSFSETIAGSDIGSVIMSVLMCLQMKKS